MIQDFYENGDQSFFLLTFIPINNEKIQMNKFVLPIIAPETKKSLIRRKVLRAELAKKSKERNFTFIE